MLRNCGIFYQKMYKTYFSKNKQKIPAKTSKNQHKLFITIFITIQRL